MLSGRPSACMSYIVHVLSEKCTRELQSTGTLQRHSLTTDSGTQQHLADTAKSLSGPARFRARCEPASTAT